MIRKILSFHLPADNSTKNIFSYRTKNIPEHEPVKFTGEEKLSTKIIEGFFNCASSTFSIKRAYMNARDLSCLVEQELDAKIAIGFALIKEAPFPLTVRLAIEA